MVDIKKILCPVDFFPASDKALQYAAALAEDYGAKMHLLHVVAPLLPVAHIVMGSHPRSGVERLFIGSVAEWLMRNSPVPILVISEKQRLPVQQQRRVA